VDLKLLDDGGWMPAWPKRPILALLWLCGAVCLLASCAASGVNHAGPAAGEMQTQADAARDEAPTGPEYVIGLGDVLSISIWRDETLSGDVIVLPDGTITFPLVGSLAAEGKTVAQLKDDLVQKIDRYVPNPTLTVSVMQINSMQIYVIGKVNRPGNYPLRTDLNVLQALSLAGGLNSFADRDRIKILRKENGQTRILPFEYDRVTAGEGLDQNIELQRGDVIVVP
jgi:polysaccharide export outer membrane protein